MLVRCACKIVAKFLPVSMASSKKLSTRAISMCAERLLIILLNNARDDTAAALHVVSPRSFWHRTIFPAALFCVGTFFLLHDLLTLSGSPGFNLRSK